MDSSALFTLEDINLSSRSSSSSNIGGSRMEGALGAMGPNRLKENFLQSTSWPMTGVGVGTARAVKMVTVKSPQGFESLSNTLRDEDFDSEELDLT
ncbi:hypothetical protein XELAEV_18023204mg [Xenopus laevis]|uniref:Uncharacterized protein n=1 Tax=Xenopus laevis TaxID=8355 RepID=A0A974D665_XENLA|nr:hypothetical protein XELAEV_18023204mg [Xenopus laevis]